MALRRIDTHYCEDSSGLLHIVDEYQNVTIVRTMAQPSREVALMTSFRVRGGAAVNRIDDDTFMIVASGTKVTRR